jgi:hypothetical protein
MIDRLPLVIRSRRPKDDDWDNDYDKDSAIMVSILALIFAA